MKESVCWHNKFVILILFPRYRCEVNGIKQNITKVISISGQHVGTKTAKDVNDFEMNGKFLRLLPNGIGELFPSLEKFAVEGSDVQTVTRSNFYNMGNVSHLSLANNRIEVLPEDVFQDLSNVEFLDLGSNLLSILPTDLLTSMMNLEIFYGHDNVITHLDKDSFRNNKKLSVLHLHKNSIETISMNFSTFEFLGNINLLKNYCISTEYPKSHLTLNAFDDFVQGCCSAEILTDDSKNQCKIDDWIPVWPFFLR